MGSIKDVTPHEASVTVGTDSQKRNELTFTIEASGPSLYLSMLVPKGEAGLIRQESDVNDIEFRFARLGASENRPSVNPKRAPKEPNGYLEYRLGNWRDGLSIPDGTAKFELKIANLLCNAVPGDAEISFLSSSDRANPKKVTIRKQPPNETLQPSPILYFCADQDELLGEGDVKLSWQVRGDLPVTVSANRSRPLAVQDGAASCEDTIGETTEYILRLKDSKYSQFSSKYTVQVWEKGWHQIQPFATALPGATKRVLQYAFPTVLFGTAGKNRADAFYALFARVRQGTPAMLCTSTDGLTNWQVIDGLVPHGMETSPGVCQQDCLWLVGGSAVDPELKSRDFWYYDPDHPEWDWRQASVEGADAFEPRMGHACVSLTDGSILVLGGLGGFQCLTDVWRFEILPDRGNAKRLRGQQLETGAAWKPRCMFGAFERNGMAGEVWVAGGMDSPNGQPLGDVWSRQFNAPAQSWQARPKSGNDRYLTSGAVATGVAPRGGGVVAVVAVRGGTNQTTTDSAMQETYSITTTQDNWVSNKDVIRRPSAANEWIHKPHSVTVVMFKDRLFARYLHRDALLDDSNDAPALYVYRW